MLALVILSSLISILTLAIRLINKIAPDKSEIPSSYLGAPKVLAPQKRKLTPPPWLPWLLILLATIGAALTYWPQLLENPKTGQSRSGLLWVDSTFSAHIARAEHDFSAHDMAVELSNLGISFFGLPNNNASSNTDIQLIKLSNTAAIEEFIGQEISLKPSPFSRPINLPQVTKALDSEPQLSGAKGTLIVISDSQRETLQQFVPLKSLFSDAKLFGAGLASSLLGTRAEIIPADLPQLWNADYNKNADTDFINFDADEINIPLHARPGIMSENFIFKNETKWSLLSPARTAGNYNFPLLTGCAAQLSGPLELDGFADLRAFAQFFGVPLRLTHCTERSGETAISKGDLDKENLKMQQTDPWKYRPRTVWVIQTNDEILGNLLERNSLWFPKGFMEGLDSIVYVAGHDYGSSEPDEKRIEQRPIQLDEDGLPAPLWLLPPPGNKPFYETTLAGDVQNRGLFQPLFSAVDKTPLAYQLGKLPYYYLRTSVAMPNGELGRSSRWTHFWLSIGNDSSKLNSGKSLVESISFESPSEAQTYLEKNLSFQKTNGLEILNLNTSKFENSGENVFPHLGLYRVKPNDVANSNALTLVAIPASERSRNTMSAEEFTALWHDSENTSLDKNLNRATHSPSAAQLSWIGSTLAAAALCLLWGRDFSKNKIGLLIILFCFIVPTQSQAQLHTLSQAQLHALSQAQLKNNSRAPRPMRQNFRQGSFSQPNVPPENTTIPFRVAWCDANISTSIARRYSELRDTLANRGTIEMPQQLIAGACQPGMADIWWTNDAAALDSTRLSEHLSSGGIFILEGQNSTEIPQRLRAVEDSSVGLIWEVPRKKGLLYRSFYLLQSFDGCPTDRTQLLTLRKKAGAHSPMGLVTSARFLTEGGDCFATDNDYRTRSFVNLMYSILATDYKEDQMQLPEILNRVRNLGLEP